MSVDIRKSGIPVLAYPHCDAAPVSSSMIFRFNEGQATASLLLQSSLLVDGHNEPQTFTAQYDPDNVRPGSLGPATIPIPQYRLDELAREGNPQMQTLSLTLKEMAPLWVPRDMILKPRPQPGCEAAFDRVAVLAQATRLHILFDLKWLHRDHHAVFQRFVDHPQEQRAFPVWRHYSTRFRREDWRIFEDALSDGLVGELPPQYAESSKRPRDITPTPSSHPHKRALLSPYDEHTSPTEKDSVATPSPKAPRSSAPSSPRFLPLDVTPDARRTLPIEPEATPNGALTTAPLPLLQPSLESAISSLLPSMLSSLLPSLLPRLLTLQSPSPAPSLLDAPSERGTPPPPVSTLLATPHAHAVDPPPPLSALGISISEHVARRLESEISALYSHVLSHANFLRNEADAAFFEDREGERLAWQREVEGAVEVFRERLEDVGVEEVERVEGVLERKGDRVVEEVRGRAEELKGEVGGLKKDKRELERRKKELRRDVRCLRQQKRDLRRDVEDLRRQKGDLSGELLSRGSCSVLGAGSAVDSQDLDS